MRYELYRYDFYKNGNHIGDQSKIYRNVYPSVTVSRQIGNVNMNLSYSSKSEKPPYNALDGNVRYVSRNLYRGGNPLLKPSTIHDFQLAMSYDGLIVSADYIRMKNPLYYTYTFYNADQTVILASYDNYPKVNFFQAEAYYSKKFGIWKPQLSVDLLIGDYEFEQLGKVYRQDKPLVNINFNHIFTLPHGWYVYLYALYQTNGCNEEGLRMKERSRVSFYVVKRWRNFTFDVLFNDIFRTYKEAYSSISPACMFSTSQYMDTRNIQISIRYSFNSTRSKYKGTNAAAEELNRL